MIICPLICDNSTLKRSFHVHLCCQKPSRIYKICYMIFYKLDWSPPCINFIKQNFMGVPSIIIIIMARIKQIEKKSDSKSGICTFARSHEESSLMSTQMSTKLSTQMFTRKAYKYKCSQEKLTNTNVHKHFNKIVHTDVHKNHH